MIVEPAEPTVAEVDLALDQLVPGRRGRVLEIGHEHLGAAIERVDHHLGVGRAGDLDAAVLQVGGNRADRPVGVADGPRVLAEVGKLAGVEPLSAARARVEQQFQPARVEPLVQLGDEGQRIGASGSAPAPGTPAAARPRSRGRSITVLMRVGFHA